MDIQRNFDEQLAREWAAMVAIARRAIEKGEAFPEYEATVYIQDELLRYKKVTDWILDRVSVTSRGEVIFSKDFDFQDQNLTFRKVLDLAELAEIEQFGQLEATPA